MLAYISFPGFYETAISAGTALENEACYRAENGENVDGLYLRDIGEYNEKVAARYVELYSEFLNVWYYDMLENGIDYSAEGVKDFYFENEIKFHSVVSPRYYNFSTDACCVEISPAALRALRKIADLVKVCPDRYDTHFNQTDCPGAVTFSQYVSERMRPRDGFIPFYSQDVREWGPVSEWNCAQIEVLFNFLLPDGAVMDENAHFYDMIEYCESIINDYIFDLNEDEKEE